MQNNGVKIEMWSGIWIAWVHEHTFFEVNKPVSNCVCLFWCMHRTISFADDELMIIIMIMYRCIHVLINPRRMRERVTVVGLCVCVCVSVRSR